MKNLKIIAILFLVVAVSYFLFMVSGKKEASAPVVEQSLDLASSNVIDLAGDATVEEASVPEEKSFAAWSVDGQTYKSLGVQTVQYYQNSVNYPNDGESLLIFGDYESGTMSLIFPGKSVANFIGMQNRSPYFEPMLHYGFSKDGQSLSFTSTVDITGDAVQIEITRWDDQFIEGKFFGLLTDLQLDGYHYDNKLQVSEGVFKIDLIKHPLKEI
jgi:hypothetical protein